MIAYKTAVLESSDLIPGSEQIFLSSGCLLRSLGIFYAYYFYEERLFQNNTRVAHTSRKFSLIS